MTERPWTPPVWVRTLRLLLPAVVAAYAVTLVPGVRGPEPVFVPWLEIGVGNGSILLSGLLCVARAVLVPRARVAWAMIGAAPLVYVAGSLYYYVFQKHQASVPYPSLSDAFWLSVYPALAVGLVLLVRSTLTGARVNLWLDGLTSGFGAAALLGAVVLRPVLEVTGGAVPVVVTNLAYPVGDLALLTVVMLVFNLHGWRPPALWWLVGWVTVVLLVADSAYLLEVASDTYVDGGFIDVSWSVAFVALGPAAWVRPPEPRPARHSRASLAVPAVLSVLSTIVLFAGAVQSMPFMVALFGLLAVLIATLRLGIALLETWRLVLARLEARTDELTGLPNRRRFLELVGESLDSSAVTAVMVVDLDRFKQVNDSLGHGVGDTLLQVIGTRLERRVRTDDTVVARLGGDEFAVIVTDQDETVAYTVAARMREVICEPVELSGVTLSVDASVGIALAPQDGTTWESLLSKADAAMYVAKRTRTGVEFFSEDRDETSSERLSLLAELRDALGDGSLDVHYQPVYSLRDGSVTSAEALVRWPHPERGMLSPAEFLPVAVEAGLGRQLSDEVLRMATRQAASWLASGHRVPVAVNLFEADLVDTELVVRVAAACDAAGLPADLLQIEVTESITASVVGAATPNLAALAERGHTLLLDDFGTGYSSLSFLRDLPLHVVKLDRSFFADLDRLSVRTIVSSTVGMAHALGLQIVAEGVETQAALAAVRELGCDAIQGFVLHRPVAAAELTKTLLRDLARPGDTPVAT